MYRGLHARLQLIQGVCTLVIQMPRTKQVKTGVLIVRINPTLKRACEEVSDRAGLSLSEWTRAVLALAVHEGAFAPRKGGSYGRKREN